MTEPTDFWLDTIPPSKRRVELYLTEQWHDGEPAIRIAVIEEDGSYHSAIIHAFPLMVAAEKLFEQTREAVRQKVGDGPCHT